MIYQLLTMKLENKTNGPLLHSMQRGFGGRNGNNENICVMSTNYLNIVLPPLGFGAHQFCKRSWCEELSDRIYETEKSCGGFIWIENEWGIVHVYRAVFRTNNLKIWSGFLISEKHFKMFRAVSSIFCRAWRFRKNVICCKGHNLYYFQSNWI